MKWNFQPKNKEKKKKKSDVEGHSAVSRRWAAERRGLAIAAIRWRRFFFFAFSISPFYEKKTKKNEKKTRTQTAITEETATRFRYDWIRCSQSRARAIAIDGHRVFFFVSFLCESFIRIWQPWQSFFCVCLLFEYGNPGNCFWVCVCLGVLLTVERNEKCR